MAEAREQAELADVDAPSTTSSSAIAIVESPATENVKVGGHNGERSSAGAVSAPRWSYSNRPSSLRPVTQTLHTVHQLPAPSLGPVGPSRHPALVLALCAVTLGAYSVAWHRRVNREMADFDARLEVRPAASALGVALAWATGLFCSLAGAAILVGHAVHVGPVIPLRFAALLGLGVVAIPYLVLLLPPAAVATVMTMERLRLVQERVGMRGDRQVRPVGRLAVLAVPVIGGLWHIAAFQSHLNAVWKESRLAALPEPPQHYVDEG